MKKPYRYLDHTADLGIEIWGKDLDDLFVNIGRAIFETQVRGTIRADAKRSIEVRSDSLEDLAIDWCRELLYAFAVQGFMPREYDLHVRDNSLRADLRGDEFDPRRHRVKLEIKNPTYHDLSVEEIDRGYKARIIFDV